jgi:hypothetical protein
MAESPEFVPGASAMRGVETDFPDHNEWALYGDGWGAAPREPSREGRLPTELPVSAHDDLLVYLAFLVFGLASWCTLNAVYIELPALQTVLPEGKELGTYALVAIQLGNVFPCALLVLDPKYERVSLRRVIHVVLAMAGTIAAVRTYAHAHFG